MPTYTATNNLNDLVETNPPATGYVNTDLGPAELETRRTFKAVILKEHNADGTHATVNGAVLVAGSVPGTALAAGAVAAASIAAGSITATQIANDTITYAQIANGTITGGKIANQTIPVGALLGTTAGSIWVVQAGGGLAEVAMSGAATLSAAGVLTLTPSSVSQALSLYADVETTGTDGGTFTSGAWQTRKLNSKVSDVSNIWSLSGNTLSTAIPGVYYIRAEAPAYEVDLHQIRLYDPVNAVVIADGIPVTAISGAANQSISTLEAVVIVTTGNSQSLILQHYCATTQATNGLGKNAGFGDNCTFARITIFKLA